MRHLIAGNWKMNGLGASLDEAAAIAESARACAGRVDVMLCPPATLVERMRRSTEGTRLRIGGQDCHAAASGAHTGDISAEMLADAGATAVIVGHSERRTDYGESDAIVLAKAEAARRAGLVAIVCIGESEAERDGGETLAVVSRQLNGSVPAGAPADIVVAYEPVWAIGTGRTPSEADISAVHAHIRSELERRFGPPGGSVRILYGGSMKPGNAAAILALSNVNGGLIGGASLTAADFLAIVHAAESLKGSTTVSARVRAVPEERHS
jgi:triosephosphate isomerase